MSPTELRASLGLAGIFALRMLGMFILLPVFAVYATHLQGGESHAAVGMALGAYGLTQALLQLPFGMWSDRVGRKTVMYVGLALFALGSFLAAASDSIVMVTLGRALQGSGAISAAITALLADLTREEHRTKAMAMIGMTIGITFSGSLALGPWLAHQLGVNGIFALTGVLALVAMLVVRFIVPNPPVSHFHSDAEANPAQLREVLRHGQLRRLNFGIFALHAAQMAMFVVMPWVLIHTGQLPPAQHWHVYLPAVCIGFVVMIPAIIYGEKRAQLKPVLIGAITLMVLAQLGLVRGYQDFRAVVALLILYFIAFNILEASLPSLVSKIAPPASKGTAMGVYNTFQSLGLFTGAAVGGWAAAQFGRDAVFFGAGVLMFAWLMLAIGMPSPPAVKTKLFHLPEGVAAETLRGRLLAVKGVYELAVLPAEQAIYLKVAQQGWDEATTLRLIYGEEYVIE